MKERIFLTLIFLICISFFSPFLLNPEILTFQDNDLGRTYIPVAKFIQKSLTVQKQIPLWRSDQMMGETVIGNPVSSVLYPANILFLLNNIHFATIIYFILHFLIAAYSTFFLARSFSLSLAPSFAAAIFYAFSTKLLLHLSAGHLTMIAAFSYFPLVFLSVRKVILAKSNFPWTIICAAALSLTYLTYPTIFYYSSIFIFIYWLYFFTTHKRIIDKSRIVAPILIFIITFGLSAIALIPQIEFAPLSTRSSLKLEDVALPLWNFKRFLASLIFPYGDLSSFDHESLLYLGVIPSVLAFFGFLKLPRLKKVILMAFSSLTLLYVAGLSTPLFAFAYKIIPFLKYSRITTRLWFIVALVIALLAAYALEKTKKKFIFALISAFLIESFFIVSQKIKNIPYLFFADEKIYQFISEDKDIFRVYCTTYCFNPQLVSTYRIQLLNGETPIQDARFTKFLESAGNYHYSGLAVIFPPYQVWQKENPPTPNSKLLGQANVKYVASTYQIKSFDFDFIDKFENVYLYYNKNYKNRVYFKESSNSAQIQKYYSNNVIIKVEKLPVSQELIFSENYFPGWYAYINHQKYKVESSDYNFRKIVIPPNTEMIELKYQPDSLATGKTITFATVISILIVYIYFKKKKNG